MSKTMSVEELVEHCENAAYSLKKLLLTLSNSQCEKMKKRAMLIAYWVNTYVRYIRSEDSFSPESVFKLKRGAVVRVEFGYRVGRELGGRHYAMVVDSNNSIYRNTVTVVPLGSLKEIAPKDDYSVILADGVFGAVSKKVNAVIEEAERTEKEADSMNSKIEEAQEADKPAIRIVQRQKYQMAKELLASTNKWQDEINHLKQGTVAKVDQITTVSKMRISQPLNKEHPLYGIRLTPQDMNMIDTKLHKLYFNNHE